MVVLDSYFKILGLAIFCLPVRFTLQLSFFASFKKRIYFSGEAARVFDHDLDQLGDRGRVFCVP